MIKILKKKWFNIIILLLCILKQLIAASLPIFARDAGGPDQYKLLIDAENIFEGTYILNNGYDLFTLFKRAISFPTFLAGCHWLGISYLTGYTLLYTLSSLFALYALMQIVNNRGLLIISFAIILFCPFSYDNIVQMIYNLSFTAPLAIAAISCLVIAYTKRNEGNHIILFWNFIAAINLAGIWLNREDSIWIMPLIVCFMLVMSFNAFKSNNKIAVKILICLLPVVIVILSDISLSLINYKKFGIYTTNDYTATNFELAYNKILEVQQDYFPAKCSITKGTLESIYLVSPAMNELKVYMDEFYDLKSYDKNGTDPDDGEIEDGWMNIALRDAASRCGYYKDAITANEFWGRVSREIEAAFKNDLLAAREMMFFGSTLHHPWRKNAGYATMWMKGAGELLIGNMKHVLAYPQLTYNFVEEEMIERYEAMTLNYSVDSPRYVINIAGWLYLKDNGDEYKLQLVDQNGFVLSEIKLLESPDIANELNSNTAKCRFSVKIELKKEQIPSIRVTKKDKGYKDIPCSNDNTYDNIAYYFDVIETMEINDHDEAYATNRIQIATSVANIYSKTGPFLSIIFVLGYIYKTIKFIQSIKNRKYKYLDEWIFQSAILGSIIIFLAAISFVHTFMWGALFYTHTMGTLLDFACATSVAIDGNIIYKKIKKL